MMIAQIFCRFIVASNLIFEMHSQNYESVAHPKRCVNRQRIPLASKAKLWRKRAKKKTCSRLLINSALSTLAIIFLVNNVLLVWCFISLFFASSHFVCLWQHIHTTISDEFLQHFHLAMRFFFSLMSINYIYIDCWVSLYVTI